MGGKGLSLRSCSDSFVEVDVLMPFSTSKTCFGSFPDDDAPDMVLDLALLIFKWDWWTKSMDLIFFLNPL